MVANSKKLRQGVLSIVKFTPNVQFHYVVELHLKGDNFSLLYQAIGLMSCVHQWSGRPGSIPGRVILKT